MRAPTGRTRAQHPLVEDLLARLRDKTTPSDEFRGLARQLARLLVAEATRDLALEEVTLDTPLEKTTWTGMTPRWYPSGANVLSEAAKT